MRIPKQIQALVATSALLALSVTPARAVTLTGINDISGIIGNPNSAFGPPPTARFTEPGPITVPSGTDTPLYRGPGAAADALLFVLSSYTDPTGGSMEINGSSSNFGSSFSGVLNFIIPGIGNGTVNGVKVTDSFHAAILGTGFDFSGATDTLIDLAKITLGPGISNARVDIFGLVADNGGWKVINNTPNSGSVGVRVPEPASAIASLLALGMGGLLFRRRLA